MKEFVWRIYLVVVFAPALLIGAVLSVLTIPILIGFVMVANDLLDRIGKRHEEKVDDVK